MLNFAGGKGPEIGDEVDGFSLSLKIAPKALPLRWGSAGAGS